MYVPLCVIHVTFSTAAHEASKESQIYWKWTWRWLLTHCRCQYLLPGPARTTNTFILVPKNIKWYLIDIIFINEHLGSSCYNSGLHHTKVSRTVTFQHWNNFIKNGLENIRCSFSVLRNDNESQRHKGT